MANSRTDVWIPSATPGVRLHAWQYTPRSSSKQRVPVIVGAPGFAFSKASGFDEYGKKFSEAGYAAVLFDYRTFGQSEGTPRNLADLASQLQDYRSALAWVRGQSAFDPERTVLFGAAFSGGHAVTVAAEDGHIAAVLGLCPMINAKEAGKSLHSPWLIPVGLYGVLDRILSLVTFGFLPPLYIPATHPHDLKTGKTNEWIPGIVLTKGAPQFYKECDPESPRYVTARVVTDMATYMPVDTAVRHSLKSPTLLISPAGDNICPLEATKDFAARVPSAEVKVLGDESSSHFAVLPSCVDGNIWQDCSQAMVEFLAAKLS